MKTSPKILAVFAAVTMIGSVVAATNLVLQQQASAFEIKDKDFKDLTKQFQRDVLDLASMKPLPPEQQLTDLFDKYQQDVFIWFRGIE